MKTTIEKQKTKNEKGIYEKGRESKGGWDTCVGVGCLDSGGRLDEEVPTSNELPTLFHRSCFLGDLIDCRGKANSTKKKGKKKRRKGGSRHNPNLPFEFYMQISQ
mmetsp:Transcript_126/g.115  ORF Transcript_126/g.115 Transcript_126/m.115 type:complete len:105 (-) Transcript_126:607-921(-)